MSNDQASRGATHCRLPRETVEKLVEWVEAQCRALAIADRSDAYLALSRLRSDLKDSLAAVSETVSRDAIIEECAKVCERQADSCEPGSPAIEQNWPFVLDQTARRIRALKNAASQGGGSQSADESTERGKGHARVPPSEPPISTVPAVAASIVTETESRETVWLIESGNSGPVAHWLGLDPDMVSRWTADPSNAIRFARKQDAEAMISMLDDSPPPKATEHIFGFAARTETLTAYCPVSEQGCTETPPCVWLCKKLKGGERG